MGSIRVLDSHKAQNFPPHRSDETLKLYQPYPKMASFPSTPVRSSLAGTRTAIFGGSAGMGKATAAAVLALGGRVTLISRTQSKLDAAAAELGGGDNIEVAAIDATNAEAVANFFADVEAGYFSHIVVTLGPAVHGADDIFGEATLDKVQQQFSKFNVA